MKLSLGKLVWANLKQRPLTAFLNLLLLSFGTGTIALLMLLGHQIERRMTTDAKGIDLVVGAKGSPLQLILSAVYHLDIPTGNIKLSDAQMLMRNPFLKKAIPVALGDGANGFRIVGTTPDLLTHYKAKLQTGRLFKAPLEVVLGQHTAETLGKKVGDTLIGAHGMAGEGEAHQRDPYTIVGILKPSGTVLDRLVLTQVESIWRAHEEHTASGEPHEEMPKEVTALLLTFRSPIATITMPRFINQNTNMMAAQPAFELARLFELMGVGLDVIKVFGGLLMSVSAISVFVALRSALEDRRYDMAILRTLGASRGKLFTTILLEGLLLSGFGAVLGIGLAHVGVQVMGSVFQKAGQLSLSGKEFAPDEPWIFLLALGIGFLSSLGPAIGAYRADISKTLAEGG